jgi:Flp pilus assembly protein TadD
MKVGWRTVIPTRHPFTVRHCLTERSMAAAALGLALFAGGCQNISTLTTAATVAPQQQPQLPSQPQPQLQPPPAFKSEAEWRTDAENLAARYRAKPDDPATALAYAQALRGSSQRAQAVSVLQQASFKHPRDTALLGAYGRALSDVGNFEQALEVLARAHTPEQPDWRILSAEGAVLDQLGRHDEAQRYYSSALKIKPDDPGVLSNLGLSYALAKDLKNAEATLRRATTGSSTDPRVRQNLALVVGLQGRFGEAENIARADLPTDEAAANVAYLRQMLAQQADLKTQPRPRTLASADRT